MNRSKRKWNCVDCNRCTKLEHYFVKSEIWFISAGMSEKGMLCIDCIEVRIGRQLNSFDFTEAHINNPKTNSMTDKLRNRIGASNEVQLARA